MGIDWPVSEVRETHQSDVEWSSGASSFGSSFRLSIMTAWPCSCGTAGLAAGLFKGLAVNFSSSTFAVSPPAEHFAHILAIVYASFLLKPFHFACKTLHYRIVGLLTFFFASESIGNSLGSALSHLLLMLRGALMVFVTLVCLRLAAKDFDAALFHGFMGGHVPKSFDVASHLPHYLVVNLHIHSYVLFSGFPDSSL